MIVAFSRVIGPVPIDVVIREKHEANLAITKIPIERGADITDHAYREPYQLDLEITSGASVATWNALKRFQQSRQPFTIVSGLEVYRNMLIEHLDAERDAQNAFVLFGNVHLTEVIITSSGVAPSSQGSQGGRPGGAGSTRAARPSRSGVTGAGAQSRAAETVARGDSATRAVPANQNSSILSRLTG